MFYGKKTRSNVFDLGFNPTEYVCQVQKLSILTDLRRRNFLLAKSWMLVQCRKGLSVPSQNFEQWSQSWEESDSNKIFIKLDLFVGPGKRIQAPSTLDVFFISALAKLGATIVTYPLQLIKARQMSAGKHTHADRQYSGTINAILRIWKTEGTILFLYLAPYLQPFKISLSVLSSLFAAFLILHEGDKCVLFFNIL